jgi:hypothetical protein
MNEIKVKKEELLTVLKRNRYEHRAIFLEALEGYRKQVIAELEVMLAEAKSGRQIRRAVSLVEPINQTSDYDRIIRILEMETRDEIQLQEREFAQYVMDDWAWKQQFTSMTSTYTNR